MTTAVIRARRRHCCASCWHPPSAAAGTLQAKFTASWSGGRSRWHARWSGSPRRGWARLICNTGVGRLHVDLLGGLRLVVIVHLGVWSKIAFRKVMIWRAAHTSPKPPAHAALLRSRHLQVQPPVPWDEPAARRSSRLLLHDVLLDVVGFGGAQVHAHCRSGVHPRSTSSLVALAPVPVPLALPSGVGA